jgi:hypothetical protein
MISPSLRLEIARLGRLLLEAIARAGEPSIESPSRGESWPGSPPLIILITLGRAKVCTEQVRGTFPVTRRGIVRRGVTTPYSSNYRPPPRLRPPTETLWKIRREHVTWSCELRFHGESYGWEAQILPTPVRRHFDRCAMPGRARQRPVARHPARQELHKGHRQGVVRALRLERHSCPPRIL